MKFLRNLFNRSRPKVSTYDDGTKAWRRNGRYHREDGPAIEYADGSKAWYRNGQLDREDGPAIEHVNGSKAWYRFGQIHRENGPALENADGSKAWCRFGHLHRDDGPAIERPDGSEEWWKQGQKIASVNAREGADNSAAETIGAVQDGLAQTITVHRPLRFKRQFSCRPEPPFLSPFSPFERFKT